MDFLKTVLGDELFQTVSQKVNDFNSANPDNAVKIANLSSGEYVSSNKHKELETEANGYKTQLEQLSGEIKKLKDNAANGGDEIRQQLGELQQKYDNDTKNLKETIDNLKFDSALDSCISQSGAKSIKALKGVLDMEKISFENGAIKGFDEQLENLKKEYDYLFKDVQSSTGMSHGSTSPEANKLSDAEYYAQYYNKKK